MILNFNNPTELLCAQLCSLSYEGKREIDKVLTRSSASLIEYYSDRELDAQAFTAHHNGTMYITFRGSETVMDWLVDLFCLKRNHYVNGVKTRVHRGFLEATNNISGRIIEDIRQEYHRIVLCGHSLGAAMSTIFATQLPQSVIHKVEHYFYGSPRIGNKAFQRAYGQKGIIHKRIVNGIDLVNKVPPKFFNYHHAGTAYMVNHTGGIIRDHLIDNYIEAVQNSLKQKGNH